MFSLLIPRQSWKVKSTPRHFSLDASEANDLPPFVPKRLRTERSVFQGDAHKTGPSKLLVLDVEGTLFETKIRLPSTTISSTIWQAIAVELGPEAVTDEVDTHQKWASGFYASYLDWMKDTIRIHRKHGLSETKFQNIISAATYTLGVEEVLKNVDRNRFEIVLVSGGFRELALRAQKDFLIHHSFTACEYIFGDDGLLESFNLLPCDFEGKIDFIKLMLREYGLSSSDWLFVGDGSNDIPIARSAPFSVAFGDNVSLRSVSTTAINSFRELLPLLNSL
jgi:phosphoserine phosphatase